MRGLLNHSLVGMFLLLWALGGTVQAAETADEPDPQPRAARSVHLWYRAPEGTIFYNEAIVQESYPGSYFMACGFNHGYFGIQEINDRGDKVVIFSIWDPGQQNNPDSVSEDERVKVLFQGDGVRISRFGNEGTGGKSMFPYDWQIGQTYRFCVKVTVEGDHTNYAAYFYLNDSKEWKHLATFQTITNGDYLKGYYSFVEDFRRNGVSAKQRRKALYGNGWVYTKDKYWVSLTQSQFGADNTPVMNIDAGIENNWFYLANGGDTTNTTKVGSEINRSPVDLP